MRFRWFMIAFVHCTHSWLWQGISTWSNTWPPPQAPEDGIYGSSSVYCISKRVTALWNSTPSAVVKHDFKLIQFLTIGLVGITWNLRSLFAVVITASGLKMEFDLFPPQLAHFGRLGSRKITSISKMVPLWLRSTGQMLMWKCSPDCWTPSWLRHWTTFLSINNNLQQQTY